jgi:hypothetical protein
MMKTGVYIFGVGTLAAGILDLIWGEFEGAHQPVQALGDDIAGLKVLVYIAAVWLVAAGAAVMWRRSRRIGAGAAAIIYGFFALALLPRFYTAPHFLGYRASVFIGVLAGVGQQLILVVAMVIVFASQEGGGSLSARSARIARWIFGLCSVDFGLAHLTGVPLVAAMVPKWIPFGGDFWAVLTGIAFVLAGLAILSRILDILAARLLALMLLGFSALTLAPHIFASPRDHVAWGGNAYNLAAVGAALIFAEWLATSRAVQKKQGVNRPKPSLA